VLLAAAALAHACVAEGAPVLPTGRPAAPAGRITALQAFPTGLAASPDGRFVLAVAGPAIQGGVPEGTSGGVALKLVNARTGQVRQTVNVDDAFQGAAYDKTGAHAYVAGGAGDTIHVFSVAADGTLSKQPDLPAAAFVSDVAL